MEHQLTSSPGSWELRKGLDMRRSILLSPCVWWIRITSPNVSGALELEKAETPGGGNLGWNILCSGNPAKWKRHPLKSPQVEWVVYHMVIYVYYIITSIIYYIYMYILVTSIYISRYFSIGMEQLPHIHCPRSLLRSTTSKSSY